MEKLRAHEVSTFRELFCYSSVKNIHSPERKLQELDNQMVMRAQILVGGKGNFTPRKV
jgi:hypothetical protein